MNHKNKPLHLINPGFKKAKKSSNEPKLFGVFSTDQVRNAVRNVTFGLASMVTPGGIAGGFSKNISKNVTKSVSKNVSKNVGKTGFKAGSAMDKFHSKTGLDKAFFDRVKANNPNATSRTGGTFPFIQGSGRSTSQSVKAVSKNYKN